MSPNPPDENETPDTTASATSKPSTSKSEDNAPVTPRKAAGGAAATTPKSAPARPRAHTMKKAAEPPTLLADFLRGRPSPQRLAADRRRRMSLDAVKAEMRAEMRQAAVAKIQQPGGVRDRVNKWQKANAAVMAAGDPAATPSEPTELAFPGETESVTEEDRVRIKLRQKKRPTAKVEVHNDGAAETGDSVEDLSNGEPKAPPKKRVVSDDHWMAKKNKKDPPRSKSPKKDASPSPLPKGFVQKTPIQAPVARKIQDWAMKVEMPDPPPAKHRATKSTGSLDGSRIQLKLKELQERQTTPRKAQADDDGIRVTPIRKKPDDGIRVRPLKTTPKASNIQTSKADKTRERSREHIRGASSRQDSDHIVVVEEEDEESDRIEVIEEPESHLGTPTRKPSKARKVSRKKSAPAPAASEDRSWVSSSESAVKTAPADSELAPSSLTSAPGAKPLDEIPFGFSAFSELDLPLDRGKTRKKAQRNPSFKAADVLKKVVSEGKKILHDAVEPPKQPVANQPPSIEKWLNGTVDPFVDEPKQESKSRAVDKKSEEQTETARNRSVDEHKRTPSPPTKTELSVTTGLTESTQTTESTQNTQLTQTTESTESTETLTDLTASTDLSLSTDNDENIAPKGAESKPKNNQKTPMSAGLRRRAATRGAISPVKTVKKPFREILKEAFRGESSGHQTPPTKYISEEERRQEEYESYDEEEDWRRNERRRSSSGSSRSYSDRTYTDESSLRDDRTPTPRRRPPTNGVHELSTIAGSADTFSTYESDVTSQLSETTITQTTALTRDTEVPRRRSNKSGLKRRLTKHSDLVSVLSLPDDSQVPGSLRSLRSRPSVRTAANRLDTVTVNDLLREFSDDENLYQRELKTLVDGVIPVLLSTVLHDDSASAANLFGPESPGRKANGMSKAVVNMGVALEKLKTAHKRASHTDINRLISWLHTASPIYDSYMDAWRLGFQDLIVNLAPAADRLDDEDSLIDALPRNAEGDVVNEDGERVDVAHLLKRPLLRVRTLAKFTRGVHTIVGSYDTLALVGDYNALQEKVRRRHREESARLADEDAINTDTTRIRDLRTLAPMESVKIDPKRQVNAKDLFSLSLAHSNGQRLECQVELVHRDLPGASNDKGDLLIRETGTGRRTWLLFPPMPMTVISARRGDTRFEIVLMVQGTHNSRQWYELLNLVTDNDDQVADWLSIIGTTPVPPKERLPAVVEEVPESPTRIDVPVGGKLYDRDAESPEPITPRRSNPSRYHNRSPRRSLSPERTPTQDSYDDESKKRAAPNTTPYREDGAPPPPIHRSLGPKSPQLLPPVDLQSPRIKRRGSSPLKHEYLPSEESSDTSASVTEISESETETESDWESSEDEFEDGIPETEVGFSIREPEEQWEREVDFQPQHQNQHQHHPQHDLVTETAPDSELDEFETLHNLPPRTFNESFVEQSVVSSVCSLTPSNSASQAGLHGRKTSESYTRYIASISYWSEKKGHWKDIAVDPCSIQVTAGVIEAYSLVISPGVQADLPLLSLELTPLVLLRQSTVVDLEIRSAVKDNCKNKDIGGGNFRFRCPSSTECFNLYMAVHHARLNNRKFIQLENEARYNSFGERPSEESEDTSSRRRSWFGRKNSYRASTRAPSQSQDGSTPSSSLSATSFLKRLTGAGTFNLARSSIDKQKPFSGNNSLYTSESSSDGYPRSPSISMYSTSIRSPLASDNIKIRLHLLVTSTKWEDYGNCILQIRRPPPGWHQELRANHGLEKRVTVTTLPKKDKPRIVLDAVLGSGCFTPMGSRGIVCGIWEELRDERGEIGVAPKTGGAAGSVKKWCFQCASVTEAQWVLRLVHQEVELRE
ncbi:glucan 4-alpha-glucosidase [Colletotrichum plurivorum]|uniref:Glucan 4-alpha-glucosidase n=1 Tax=Colletotrichum plurivorum TaxID=2175906 RepID=A0A8H6KR67_9PEZI|nr:glucan 4-alpha-glucosidase [Colletotrichum plurivorum]